MIDYPKNNKEYLSQCPEQDGEAEYGEYWRNQPTLEELRESIRTLKKIRALLLGLDEPS